MGLTIVGIDPGLHTGVAWLHDTRLGPELEQVAPALKIGGPDIDFGFCEISDRFCRPDAIVIEVPEAYPGSQVRVSDIVELAFLAGAVAERARLFFAAVAARNKPAYKEPEVIKVHPRKWKGQLPKAVHHERLFGQLPWLRSEATKFRKSEQEHIIDAVGLALYGIATMKEKAR